MWFIGISYSCHGSAEGTYPSWCWLTIVTMAPISPGAVTTRVGAKVQELAHKMWNQSACDRDQGINQSKTTFQNSYATDEN